MGNWVLCSLLLTTSFLLSQTPNWHEDAFFGIHFDLHPNANDKELGREVDAEQIRSFLEKVKPDYVQYDCKGHPGYTGYPTKVGSPSPGIVNDALRVWRNVTKEMGIPLSIHYSGVWDTRAIELHPEWGRRKQDGTLDTNNTCRTSDYDTQLMIPQLLEVIQEYDIDGMWIDGENWASYPCWCERCQQKFTEATGIKEIPKKKDDVNWEAWVTFHRGLFTKHVQQIVESVHKVKPSCMVCSNWLYTMRQPEAIEANVDYLSGDFTPSFGAKEACFEARFLASRGKPWDLMAWSFIHSSSIGKVMKTVPHLCQELSEVLSQGGSVFIYDNPKRSGRLVDWHTDLLAKTGEFCKERKNWCFKTKTLPQIAVLHSETTYYKENEPLYQKYGSVIQPVEGAVTILLELGYSVDIVNEDTLVKVISQYPIVVIPERAHVPDTVMDAVKQYTENGGKLIISGSFLAERCGDWLGVEGTGEKVKGWLPVPDGTAVPTAGEYEKVRVINAKGISSLMNNQEQGRDEIGFPSVTIKEVGTGAVMAIYGPFFKYYASHPVPGYRQLLEFWLREFGTNKLLIMRESPWYVELTTRQRENQILLNLVNRGVNGYLSSERHMVESVPIIQGIRLHIPKRYIPSDKKIATCYLVPSQIPLDIIQEQEEYQIVVPQIQIYDIAVINLE
ncbi:MAG TPA: alpha-L-fucosidase [Candidatus Hydrogenedens sp.]|nr:alpha-L-fucosidase [Candidatus Hydrogenedens sp.]HOL19835.1 alpha-L-fucosidase [Candidatus Hydrogenedens sp.]HPP59582.1 alpha-L-fucosidase [Candidatus Hydrogenedens sp.]